MMLTEIVLLLIAMCMVMSFTALQGQPHMRAVEVDDDECDNGSERWKSAACKREIAAAGPQSGSCEVETPR